MFPLEITSSPRFPNFGVNPDGLSGMPKPIRFFATVEWSLPDRDCPRLGCPMLDPRNKAKETLQFTVDLQSGKRGLYVNFS